MAACRFLLVLFFYDFMGKFASMEAMKVIGFGALSGALYVLLYFFSGEVIEAEQRVQEGELFYAGLPVVIGFSFSFVHGTFTGHFWDLLGLKPKKKK